MITAQTVPISSPSAPRTERKSFGMVFIRPEDLPLSPTGRIVDQAINQIPRHYNSVFVDKYCIMPDHVHLILRIESEIDGRIISAPTLSMAIGSMKRWVSKQVGKPIGQKSYYDHVIRNQRDYDEIRQYIENNPKKWLIQKKGYE